MVLYINSIKCCVCKYVRFILSNAGDAAAASQKDVVGHVVDFFAITYKNLSANTSVPTIVKPLL